ncbi:hypothetical protein NECID01_0612 [Nematocida sp. AWRm77]|nr:hypothetical protein NECID01_0612 [Nematocida sp. AWRm77]
MGEYTLAKQISKSVEEGEGVYNALMAGEEKGVKTSLAHIAQIIDSKKTPSPTKVLAFRLLAKAAEDKEREAGAVEIFSSIRVMFRIAEVLREDIENNTANETTECPPSTESIMDSLVQLIKRAHAEKKKDRAVLCMKECGVFLLLNAWSSPQLLRVYAAVYTEEIPSGQPRGEKRSLQKSMQEEESMPYRMLAEEHTLGVGTCLAHRRHRPMFTPRWYVSERTERADAYRYLLELQDEYEILYKSIVQWCESSSSLETVSWCVVWYIENLARHLEKDRTYEEEAVFVLGPLFFSSLQNTLGEGTLESVCLLNQYVAFLGASSRCGLPRVRGTATVAMERLGMAHAKFYMQAMLSRKSTAGCRKHAAAGMSQILSMLSSKDKHALEKTIEKHAVSIAELMEEQPREEASTHCAEIISILAFLPRIPLSLFRPSCLVLMVWAVQHVAYKEKEARKWLREYMKEGCSVYTPDKPDFLTSGLYL